MTSRLFERHAAEVRKGLQRRVAPALERHLPHPPSPDLVRAMRAALSGGKALRASLCLASADLFAPRREAWWDVALAMEAMHAYSLAHDDLPAMDNAATRRGQPSLHVAFGEAAAILAGDALQSFAFALLAEAQLPSARRVRLLARLAHAAGAAGMAGGQALDLAGAARDAPALRRMHGCKTGALIVCAVEAGALSAGASAQARRALSAWARALGAAYQLRDDMLDGSGDAALLGKPLHQDERRGGNAVQILGAAAVRTELRACQRTAQEMLARLSVPSRELGILRAAAEFAVARRA